MTAFFSQLEFARPLWLLALPVMLALGWIVARGRSPSRRLAAYADRHLLKWLIVGESSKPSWPGVLAWCLIVLAVSGPFLADPNHRDTRPGLNIALVVDISPSMAAADVEPSRLGRAKLEARDFLRRLATDRVALIAFSAYAYRVLPLTDDLPLVSAYVDALDPGLTRRQGSNVVQALELAAQSLPAAKPGRAIVLLSDGEDADKAAVLQAADRLSAQGIPVFALGIGTTGGVPVPGAAGYLKTRNGEFAVSRLDRELLQQIAQRTGGRYADTRADDADWDLLMTRLRGLAHDRIAAHAAKPGYPLFPWLLAAALAMVLWALWGRYPGSVPHVVTLLAAPLALMLGSPNAHAAPWTEHAAYEALVEGHYDEAARLYGRLETFDGLLGRGAAAYRKGDWSEAVADFAEAANRARNDDQRAKALYDQANALARLNRLGQAIALLDRALTLAPNFSRAALNRDLISRALGERAPLPPIDEALSRRTDNGPVRDSGEVPNEAGMQPRPQDQRDSTAQSRVPAFTTDGATAADASTPAITSPAAQSALAGLAAMSDDPSEVLRHRFMVIDAEHPLLREEQPW